MKTQDSQNVNDKSTDVADKKDPNTVQLETPIKRGDGHITSVTLRKPNSGELRGISLAELLQMKVDALQAVLPRITTSHAKSSAARSTPAKRPTSSRSTTTRENEAARA